jgi:hypothetical protein
MTSIKYRGAHLKWVAYLFSGARETGSFAHTATDGFTEARTTSNDPRRPHETISFSSAKNQRFVRRQNDHLPYIRENQQT